MYQTFLCKGLILWHLIKDLCKCSKELKCNNSSTNSNNNNKILNNNNNSNNRKITIIIIMMDIILINISTIKINKNMDREIERKSVPLNE